MTKTIPLTKNKVAIVDGPDYDWLSQWTWHTNGRYALRRDYEAGGAGRRYRLVFMHRLIMNAPEGWTVDHINGDGLDNRRQNLRLATHQENSSNQRVQQKPKSSKYKGVSHWVVNYNGKRVRSVYEKWRAYIVKNDRQISLGHYKTEVEAALAYDAAAKVLFGEFANLNFP